MECLVFFFMPIIPIKPLHVFSQHPGLIRTTYNTIPLRWSWGLVFRVFLLYWMLPPLFGGVLMIIIAGWTYSRNPQESHLLGGLIVTVGCSLTYLALWLTDRRNRRIRRILGRQTVGTSDPAMWTEKRLRELEGPGPSFGTTTYTEAVPLLLERGAFDAAMLAARLAVVLENREGGESLTNQVLQRWIDAGMKGSERS
jgi:hypothetical protein